MRKSSALLLIVFTALQASVLAQQVARPTAQSGQPEEILKLTAFEVRESSSDYIEHNTNSVTGTNIPLNQLPISADVYNRTLMNDLAVTDASFLFTELAGYGVARIGAGESATGNLQGDPVDFKNYTGRGLPIGNQRRDGFLLSPTSQLDMFDIERVETIRGSQSLLYGSGDAGGVINYQSKRAAFGKKSVGFAHKVDDEGSNRITWDANAGNKRVALLLAGLKENTHLWRDNLGAASKGHYIAAAWRPVQDVTVRAEISKLDRVDVLADSFTSYAGPVGDPRNGLNPALLLGTGRAGQTSNPSDPAKPFPSILNGNLNWENIDSLLGDVRVRKYEHTYYSAWVNAQPTSYLSLELRYGFDKRLNHELTASARGALTPPGVGANPFPDRWGATYLPQTAWVYSDQKGYRATASLSAPLFGRSKNQFNVSYEDKEAWSRQVAGRFYRADGNGDTITTLTPISATNPTGRNNTNAGRTAMPVAWVPITGGTGQIAYPWPRSSMTWLDGNRYNLEDMQVPGAGIVSASNPFGVNGAPAGTYSFQASLERAFTATLYSDILDDKINLMAGSRREDYTLKRVTLGDKRGPVTRTSNTAGVLFRLTKGVKAYYGYSTNAKINISNDVPDIWGNPLGAQGQGVTNEFGLKFDLFEKRLSGSATYFMASAKNEFGTLDAATRNLVDPAGINGRNSAGAGFLYNRDSDGYELSMSFAPTRSWTMLFRYSHSDGTEGSDVSLPTFYNDEFNTMVFNGVSTVATGTGTSMSPLMVKRDPRDPTSALIPLAVSMLRDRASPYYATMDPVSGQILNASEIGLVAAATGRTGLPITSHQLGFVHPSGGMVVVRKGGEKTTGYAVDNASFVTSYSLPNEMLKGVTVGSTFSVFIDQRSYYYSISLGGRTERRLFKVPVRASWNAFVKYERRLFDRFRWRMQLNVANVLNDVDVIVLPGAADGSPKNARLSASPRSISLTNSINF